MKEAWEYKSPIIYAIIRRVELTRYVFNSKSWHPSAKWTARVRALLLVLRGHETEICCYCGGKVGVVWWCQDSDLWSRLTGWEDGGISCVDCFDSLAQKAGLLLQWAATVHPQSPAPLLADANDAKFLPLVNEEVSFGGNR